MENGLGARAPNSSAPAIQAGHNDYTGDNRRCQSHREGERVEFREGEGVVGTTPRDAGANVQKKIGVMYTAANGRIAEDCTAIRGNDPLEGSP
jgi:hypothetical protein